jgi:flavodoxin
MRKTVRAEYRETTRLRRRSFLRATLVGFASVVIGAQLSGCSATSSSPQGRADTPESGPAQPTSTGSNVLLVYFSRAGENYSYGGRTQLAVGNTEVLAGIISRLIGCDVYRIEPVDPYPDDYEETVARNVREQRADARPAIANPLASLAPYDTVLLGSPIWNVRVPMIMSTFVEGFDFTGKTVFPVTTYAMSGLGTTVRDYTASCRGATIGEGLAVRGEEVQEAGAAVEAWLQRINLLTQ